jgi:AbrB family looped-hinge helix DNA binding protein
LTFLFGIQMLTNVVKVTRKGQTTIPVEVRQKLGIKEGDKLLVEATDQGQVLFKLIRKLEDCAGIYSKYAKPEEIKKHIDMLREEY